MTTTMTVTTTLTVTMTALKLRHKFTRIGQFDMTWNHDTDDVDCDIVVSLCFILSHSTSIVEELSKFYEWAFT